MLYLSLFICVFGGLQGLLLSAIIWKASKNRTGNYSWLITLLVLVSTTLIGRVLFYFENSIDIRLALFTDLVLFLFGPVFLFFVRSALFDSSNKEYRFHLILAAIHLITLLPQFFISYEHYIDLTQSVLWSGYIYLLVILALLHNGYYWYLSSKELKAYTRRVQLKPVEIKTSYLSTSHKLYGACLVLFCLSVILWPFYYIIAINIYQLSWILTSWVTFALTYYLISYPHQFGNHFIKKQITAKKFEKEEQNIKALAIKIENVLSEERVFLDPDLSLQSLAKKIQTNPVLLSKAINQELNCSFNSLINKYRTEEFINLVHSGQHSHLSYFGLALQSGFNSKTTFNKYFKKLKGETPSEFFKKLKKSA